jgi:dihydrofolate reductase
MGTILLSISTSLDGFIDHTEMIADDEAIQSATDILNSVDAMLFGRVTYQLLGDYWPTALQETSLSREGIEFANRINSMPKMVCSHTLKSVDWNNTTLINGNAVEEVIRLKRESDQRILLAGSVLANTLMELDLIDEYELRINPFLLGQGTRLFRAEFPRIPLKLVHTKTLRSGIVLVHYVADHKR